MRARALARGRDGAKQRAEQSRRRRQRGAAALLTDARVGVLPVFEQLLAVRQQAVGRLAVVLSVWGAVRCEPFEAGGALVQTLAERGSLPKKKTPRRGWPRTRP
jgi:hypothetical protein